MQNDKEDHLKQALLVVLSLNEDSGLSLDGVVNDVRRVMNEGGKYNHYCPDGAEEICGIVKKAVEEVKAKRKKH
ncbi:hypothetical protein [Leclercia adecarboxylata]|uniref:Uncharacterized protein n=1 Tax=Leclercia adecarboxylata TaxID=83655 RepID=A0ABU6I9Z3_9ENTR|nr:hypothetical protein [Leclercia adecarboxylata]MBZ3799279.1 hypothetical protein [Leclercia adecarboxylata]MBZ3803561.1 hypothetical protein [Leclercia adecarboxylata]MCH2683539.1 hypothetical protein [Leclercia adecarboxylata]MCZ7841212.1 hypothetical protein [Leclercia adecarboxylata]MDU1653846.1 hypothetical protein [Leclercia adecarboxylata]